MCKERETEKKGDTPHTDIHIVNRSGWATHALSTRTQTYGRTRRVQISSGQVVRSSGLAGEPTAGVWKEEKEVRANRQRREKREKKKKKTYVVRAMLNLSIKTT